MVGFESEFEQNGQSPQGDQVVDEGEEDLSNPDDDQSMQSPDISANANFNFYITTLTITGSGTLTESMEPGEANAYAWFNIYWRDEGGGAQNFDGSLEGRTGSRQTTTTANVSSVENLTWFHYTYTLIWTPRRYGIVQLCMNGSASFTSCGFFGFSKNRGNSYCTSRYTGGVDSSGHGVNVYLFYIYNSTWTENESTARSGSNSTTTGTYYIYFREQYELYYRDNGGDNGPGSQSFYAGLSTTLSTSRPDRTGYTFLGWSTSSTATSASYTPGANYTFSGDIDLYAVWRANVYTVTLNKNNGSGGTSTVYLRYNTGWYSNSGATTSISSVTRPSRTGYTFQGYYTETSGGTQVINSSGSFVSGRLTYTAEDDTLYARWEINEYTLTVRFYPGYYDMDPAEAGVKAARTWVMKSDSQGRVLLSEKAKVSGDPFYQTASGENVLPLGTVTFEETEAPEGYLLNEEVIVRQVTVSGSGQTDTVFQYPEILDQVIRGHIKIVKFREDADSEQEQKSPLPGIRFRITSKTTGKTTVIETDENGCASTDRNSEGGRNGLVYDTYTISEENAPEGFMPVDDFEVTIDEEG